MFVFQGVYLTQQPFTLHLAHLLYAPQPLYFSLQQATLLSTLNRSTSGVPFISRHPSELCKTDEI